LVTDELVDQRVVLDEHLARDGVEALHQPRELHRPELARELARAANVREQEGAVDLGAAHVHTREAIQASLTDVRVLLPRCEAVAAEEETADAAERGRADLGPGGTPG